MQSILFCLPLHRAAFVKHFTANCHERKPRAWQFLSHLPSSPARRESSAECMTALSVFVGDLMAVHVRENIEGTQFIAFRERCDSQPRIMREMIHRVSRERSCQPATHARSFARALVLSTHGYIREGRYTVIKKNHRNCH